jgi:hypothetical protein
MPQQNYLFVSRGSPGASPPSYAVLLITPGNRGRHTLVRPGADGAHRLPLWPDVPGPTAGCRRDELTYVSAAITVSRAKSRDLVLAQWLTRSLHEVETRSHARRAYFSASRSKPHRGPPRQASVRSPAEGPEISAPARPGPASPPPDCRPHSARDRAPAPPAAGPAPGALLPRRQPPAPSALAGR